MWSFSQSDPAVSASPAVGERLFLGDACGQAAYAREMPAKSAECEVTDLYAECASELLSYALVTARDVELARDALQETFMRYFVARSSGESIAWPRAWLYRALHNYLLDRARECHSRRERSLEPLPPVADGRHDIERELLRNEVLSMARAALTRREYDCFAMRSQGMPYEDIASELKLRSGTVGALISRAVRKVRRLVGGGCAA